MHLQLINLINYLCQVKTEITHIDLDNSITPWLGKTVKSFEYLLQESFRVKGFDLSKEQMVVLKKLDENNGLNQNELAYLTLRNKSSLTRLLSKMERKGYILRKQSTVDKRVNNVFLTALGKKLFLEAKPIVIDVIKEIEQCVTKEEKIIIINALKRIGTNLNTKIELL